MKTFDIGEAKKGTPLITRDGRKALFICETSGKFMVQIPTQVGPINLYYDFDGKTVGLSQPYLDLFIYEPLGWTPDSVENIVPVEVDTRIGINDTINPELLNKRIRDWG